MKSKVNEIAISYSGSLKTNALPKITGSRCAAELAFGQWNKNNIELQETFKIILLNNANKVLDSKRKLPGVSRNFQKNTLHRIPRQ